MTQSNNCYEYIYISFGSNCADSEGPNTKRADGGGRDGRCSTADMETAENRGKPSIGEPECISDKRHGDDDKSVGFDDYKREETMCAAQYDPECMWTGPLE
eukprot:1768912-Heterocapsa_arctica.AAC.1